MNLSLELLFILKVDFDIDVSAMNSFIEGQSTILNCNYTENINETIIEETNWYFLYNPINYEIMNAELLNKNLTLKINYLNHSIHDGYYACAISLKSGIVLFSYATEIKTECSYSLY